MNRAPAPRPMLDPTTLRAASDRRLLQLLEYASTRLTRTPQHSDFAYFAAAIRSLRREHSRRASSQRPTVRRIA